MQTLGIKKSLMLNCCGIFATEIFAEGAAENEIRPT